MKFAVTAVFWWKKYTEDEHKHLNCIWFSIIGSGFWAKWIESNGLRNWLPYIFLFVVNFASIFSSSSFNTLKTDKLIIFDTSLIEKLTFCFGFDCEHKRIWGEFFFFEIEGHFWYLKGRLWNMEPRFQSKRYHYHFINFLIILHSCCSLLIN